MTGKIVSDISSQDFPSKVSADELGGGGGDSLSLAEESKGLPRSGEKPGAAVRGSILTEANLHEFNRRAEGPFDSAPDGISNGKPFSVDVLDEEE